MPKKTLKFPTPPKAIHRVDPMLRDNTTIALVGCGGNGAQMLTKLARLDYALRECGGHGLHVIAYDPDTVTRANVGRQLFSPADVGQYKCAVLVHRLNCYYGVDWNAVPLKYGGAIPGPFPGSHTAADILISCVDTAKGRREIHKGFSRPGAPTAPRYWLDLGNKKADGQVILGQPAESIHNRLQVGTVSSRIFAGDPTAFRAAWQPLAARLPTVVEIFPELLNPRLKESNEPSCSVAEALAKQSLFVNDHITTWAALLLDNLLRKGELEHHGYFVNLETGRVNPLPVPDAQKVNQAAEAREVAA